MFIDKFIQIGFKEVNRSYPGAGWAIDYKYHPEYLSPRYYTLILFSHSNGEIDFEKADYRLYIHNNDGSFSESIFQTNYDRCKDYLDDKFKEVFKSEIRDSLLADLTT